VQSGTARDRSSESESTIKRVQNGRDSLLRQRLEGYGEFSPAQESSCGQSDIESIMGSRISHEVFADIVGKIDHLGGYFFRQRRKETAQKVEFNFGFRVAYLHHDEAIHEGDVLPHHTLVQPCFITCTVGIGCDHKSEHRVRIDQFTTIFSDTERRAVKDGVEPCESGRTAQVSLVEKEYAASLHGHSQRSILKFHVAVSDRQMPNEIRELQAVMSCGFKHRVIQASGNLTDETAFARRGRAAQVERVRLFHKKPDDDVSARIMENVVVVDGGRVSGRLIIAENHCSRRFSAEDETGVELGVRHDRSLNEKSPIREGQGSQKLKGWKMCVTNEHKKKEKI